MGTLESPGFFETRNEWRGSARLDHIIIADMGGSVNIGPSGSEMDCGILVVGSLFLIPSRGRLPVGLRGFVDTAY